MSKDTGTELKQLRQENGKLKEALRQTQRVRQLYDASIAKLKRAEDKLATDEQRFRILFESVGDYALVMEVFESGPPIIVDANEAAFRKHGYTREEMIGQPISLIDPNASHEESAKRVQAIRTGGLVRFEVEHTRKDGSTFLAEAIGKLIARNEHSFSFYVVERDITSRKQAEEELRRRIRDADKTRQAMLYMLEDMNDSNAMIQQAKQDWVATFDALADPVFLHDGAGRVVRANLAYAGQAGMAVEACIGRPYWEMFPKGDGPLRGCRDAMQSNAHEETEEEVLLPDGRTFLSHAYTMVSGAEAKVFSVHVMRDITERIRAAETLMKSLEGTITAISRAVEARDPYTSGHQQLVAKLACAIAGEMGLDAGRIQGIHMGATIHDIGKLQLPAEILSKPGALSEMELMLVKSHPQVGYDILRDIAFPWPVADIAHQHHERLDGSGYPQGLKGEAICLEARIVAVADVVEAMASHRPYRAGLGIDKALEEIEKGRGVLFDPAVVDVCLRLFRDKGFAFGPA